MSQDARKGKGGEEPVAVTLARFSGLGLTLAMATTAFLFLGRWADGRLGTDPWFTLLGAMVGAAGGFYHILQHLIFIPQREEELRKAEERRAQSEAKEGGER